VDFCKAAGLPYLVAWRYVKQGVVRVDSRLVKERHMHSVGVESGVELLTIFKLRRARVPLQRIKKAVAVLRRDGVRGMAWLALTDGYGTRNVLMASRGELERITDGQRFFSLVDVGALRGDVLKIQGVAAAGAAADASSRTA